MALKVSEKTGENEYTLTVTVDGATFEAAVNKVYLKQKNKINVPGFRKGKAPRHFIEKLYGEGVFYEDALDEVFPAAYSAALEESGVEAVSSPFDLDIVSIGKDGVELKVKVSSKPEIKLGEYKGMEVECEAAAPVTDEDVAHELSHMQEENARMIDVDGRNAENGDIATIDFEGFTDGVAFDGGKGEDYDLTLGSGTFIPGFEEQIVGHAIGESFDVNVTFPEQYTEALAGKEAVFKVTLKGLKIKELPALDDEFAKDVSEFDTMDALKEDTRAKLEKDRAGNADRLLENHALEALAEKVEASIPEAMIESAIDRNLRELEYRLQMQGYSLQAYAEMFGSDVNALRDQYRPRAEVDVKVQLALEKIAADEGIAVSEEEIAAEYEKLAEQYHMEADEIKKAVSEDALKEDILARKTAEFVKSSVKRVDPKPAEEENPAAEEKAEEKPAEKPKRTRKPAAKKTTKKANEAEEKKDSEE